MEVALPGHRGDAALPGGHPQDHTVVPAAAGAVEGPGQLLRALGSRQR